MSLAHRIDKGCQETEKEKFTNFGKLSLEVESKDIFLNTIIEEWQALVNLKR